MRASDIAFITKILQMCWQKNGIAIFSFIRTYFSVNKAKKEPKGQTYFVRLTNLRWGQPDNPEGYNNSYNNWKSSYDSRRKCNPEL